MRIILLTFLIVVATAAVSSAEVIGFPWSTWGELSYASGGNVDKGVIFDMYGEQGVDWLKLGASEWVLNTFAGIQLSASDHQSEFWNNKAKPSLGVKVKRTIESDLIGWGDVALGVRGEYMEYFHNSANDSWRAVGYVQWSAGGDWKNKKKD